MNFFQKFCDKFRKQVETSIEDKKICDSLTDISTKIVHMIVNDIENNTINATVKKNGIFFSYEYMSLRELYKRDCVVDNQLYLNTVKKLKTYYNYSDCNDDGVRKTNDVIFKSLKNTVSRKLSEILETNVNVIIEPKFIHNIGFMNFKIYFHYTDK